MKLTVLGSAAAEAIPNPFCRCEICQNARRVGGPEVRGRSAVLIDDDLLIDLGPDIISAANRLNRYLGNLSAVLVTHRHTDHWLPSNLFWREPSFASTPVAPLTVYGPAGALHDLEPYLERATALSVRPVAAGEQWQVGAYQCAAVPATHGEGHIEALLYIVSDGVHRIFYCTDTASLSEQAWDVLRSWAPLDLILLDETSGLRCGGSGHHGFERFLETRARFLQEGVMDPQTRLVAHHFSHNGGLTHADLTTRFRPYNVLTAYDGLTLTL
jgi:phosphoribosyl 1,2-cyclic phosphate phosphodiesterase